jgi:hypothetical protein
MKPARWNRAVLAGLMALSVAGGTLAPFVAGHAAACSAGEERVRIQGRWYCVPQ